MKVLDTIPKDAARLIKEEGFKVKLFKESKYTRKKVLEASDSYDYLQYQCVIRPLVQKRHNIGFRMLELLLYLYPMQYFTQKDYMLTVRGISYTMKIMLEYGWFKSASEGSNISKSLFCLSSKGRHVVEDYYKYMSGEKEIPEFVRKEFSAPKNKMDEKRSVLLEKFINEIPENKKTSLFL